MFSGKKSRKPITGLSFRVAFFLFLMYTLAAVNENQGAQEDEQGHPQISEDRLYFFDKQEVVLEDFDSPGYILDIGGGGEGIIGLLKGEQVIAIDISKRELEEAPHGPLKIVMDATDLKFLDHSFPRVTCFYTLMYIPGNLHAKVFSETFRVLSSSGKFLVWDLILPLQPDTEKDIAVIPLQIKLPGREIDTGYAAHWPDKIQDLRYYIRLAEKAGFEVVRKEDKGRVFFLELRKP